MKDIKYAAHHLKKGKTQTKTHRKPGVGIVVQEAIIHFREYHQVHRFSRNLRTMLVEFLMYDGAIEASYLQDLLYDIQGLFDLLDVMEQVNDIEIKRDS